jgi:hypothetical protein
MGIPPSAKYEYFIYTRLYLGRDLRILASDKKIATIATKFLFRYDLCANGVDISTLLDKNG